MILGAYSLTTTDRFVCCRMTPEGKDQRKVDTMFEAFAGFFIQQCTLYLLPILHVSLCYVIPPTIKFYVRDSFDNLTH